LKHLKYNETDPHPASRNTSPLLRHHSVKIAFLVLIQNRGTGGEQNPHGQKHSFGLAIWEEGETNCGRGYGKKAILPFLTAILHFNLNQYKMHANSTANQHYLTFSGN
jgi:hypothetical protein